jgi:acetyltransferase-like isoleucine patch superfamily enzyme
MLIKKSKIPFKDILLVGIWPSFIKKIIYRLKGYQIDSSVRIGIGSIITGDNVVIEKNVKIGVFTIIRADNIRINRFVKIGSFSFIDTGSLFIDEDARINEQVIIGGMKRPGSELKLGKRTIIMEYSFINTTMPITIGDDSGIGGHCLLFTHGSWLNQLEGYPVNFAPITLGEKVWLPWRVFIMPGVELGNNVVVGANSLITQSFSSYKLIAGSPAKIIKENYPNPLSNEKKEEYIKVILNDFHEYLIHNKMNVDISKKSEYWKIQDRDNRISMSIIFNAAEIALNELESDTIIFNIFGKEGNLFDNFELNLMYLNIHDQKRFGSTAAGEELVQFFSRYGIRFSRLD